MPTAFSQTPANMKTQEAMTLPLSAHATLSTIAAAMKFSDLSLLSFVGFPQSEDSGFPAFYP